MPACGRQARYSFSIDIVKSIINFMINGALNIYKEKGVTSFYVVRKIKKILGVKKCGHAGTLDPLAEGVMQVCIGRGTKMVPFLQEEEKTYEAVIRLGISTDTQDGEGRIIKQCDDIKVNQENILAVLNRFTGVQEQIPPMFSALRFQGKRLYTLARRGIEVPRKPRLIKIYGINLLDFNFPAFKIIVRCSKGTYIRTLASDIGESLECGAYLYSLKRIKIGKFLIEHSLTLEEVKKLAREGKIEEKIYSSEEMLEVKSGYLNPQKN